MMRGRGSEVIGEQQKETCMWSCAARRWVMPGAGDDEGQGG